jgi:Cu-Zn family superoxide dismutase
MRLFIQFISTVLLLASPAASLTQAQELPDDSILEPSRAIAILRDAQGNFVGTVLLTETEAGVRIQAMIQNFDAAVMGNQRGQHGFHIHEVGECEAPDFTSAGGHFNPTGEGHGFFDPDGTHAGDLINLWIEADGSGDYDVTTDLINLGEGDRNIFDEDGSSFILHQQPDDYQTDPAGNSGDRLACGVILPY